MSKRTSLSILAVTALVLSRGMFAFIDDPEGPNLLVVFIGAAIIALPSLALYFSGGSVVQNLLPTPLSAAQRLLFGIFIQVLTAGAVLFLIR